MRNYFQCSIVGGLGILLASWNAPPAAFQPGTESGSRLSSDLDLDERQSTSIKMMVDYPENFRGSVIEGAVSLNPGRKAMTLAINSLEREGERICVHGEIAAIANSRGVRGRDDSGAELALENFTPQTTTMFTSQVCSGQAEQQTCLPMTVTITTAGATSNAHKSSSRARH